MRLIESGVVGLLYFNHREIRLVSNQKRRIERSCVDVPFQLVEGLLGVQRVHEYECGEVVVGMGLG